MKKKTILIPILLVSASAGIVAPMVIGALNSPIVNVNITNESDEDFVIENLPKTIKRGKDFTVNYTIKNNKEIDWEFSDVKVNGKSIKDSGVVIKEGTITISGNKITGDVILKIKVGKVYTITSQSSKEVEIGGLPQTKWFEGHEFNAYFTITGNKVIDLDRCEITCDGKSIKSESTIDLRLKSICIPSHLINGNIVITLIASNEYTITNNSSGILIDNLPTKILEQRDIDTTWSFATGNYKYSSEESDVLINNISVKDDPRVVMTRNKLVIPKELINGNIIINLHADLYRTINFSCTTGGEIGSTSPVEIKDGLTWGDAINKGLVPKTTEHKDCTFAGWYNSDGTILKNETPITSDFEAVAHFTFNLPEVETIEEKELISCYDFDATNKEYVESTLKFQRIAKINNSPIPYIEFGWYRKGGPAEDYYGVTLYTNYKYLQITNKKHSTSAYIYYNDQKIVFEDYEKFVDWNPITYGPLASGCNSSTGKNKYFDCQNGGVTTNYKSKKQKVIDLTKYNLKVFWYETDNDARFYAPYNLFENIFGVPNKLSSKGYYDFNGKGFYQIVPGYTDASLTSKAKFKDAATDEYKTSEYMEYSYNLLALVLDFHFGLKERTRRDTGDTIEYMPNGAYDFLKDYHDAYVSVDGESSIEALRSIFKKLDDSGHTILNSYNMHSTTTKTVKDMYGDERNWHANISDALVKARKDSLGETFNAYQEYKNTEDPSKGDIAYITFDSFVKEENKSNWSENEKTAERELQDDTNESNYANDTLRLTMYANKQINKSDSNIKNVVIDLSNNGGGIVYTEHFMASWLCGGVTEKIYNPNTNDYCEYTVKADINGDGVFDENDYLKEDVKVYVITSSCSFSCGNMLPTNIQDNRPNNTVFIGTKSGGGACAVDSSLYIGACTVLRISSRKHFLRLNSSFEADEYYSNDDGCDITEGWEFDETAEEGQKAFYDRSEINKRIWA